MLLETSMVTVALGKVSQGPIARTAHDPCFADAGTEKLRLVLVPVQGRSMKGPEAVSILTFLRLVPVSTTRSPAFARSGEASLMIGLMRILLSAAASMPTITPIVISRFKRLETRSGSLATAGVDSDLVPDDTPAAVLTFTGFDGV